MMAHALFRLSVTQERVWWLVIAMGVGLMPPQVWSQGWEDGSGYDPQQPTPVFINGRPLTIAEVLGFRAMYGVVPAPGQYWYDSDSGLWGMMGAPAAGFIQPGHDMGPLPPQASGGTTGVFVNGRNLTVQEASYLHAICGTPWAPGLYWLDHLGNVTIAENPRPTWNLWVQHATMMAHYQAQMPQHGGGSPADAWVSDNFWSAGLYSAGNHNANNTQGYVNVPGYGAVSYGMP